MYNPFLMVCLAPPSNRDNDGEKRNKTTDYAICNEVLCEGTFIKVMLVYTNANKDMWEQEEKNA